MFLRPRRATALLSFAALLLAAHAPLLRQLALAPQGTVAAGTAALQALGLAVGLALALAAACGRVRWWLPVLAIAALLGPAETFYQARFGLPSGPHLYGVIAETNWDETKALLGAWMPAIAAVLVAAVALILAAARQVWNADLRWRHRSRWWLLAAAGAVGVLVVWGERLVMVTEAQAGLPEERARATSYLAHAIPGKSEAFFADLEASFPWGLPLRLKRYAEHRRTLSEHVEHVRSFAFHPQPTDPVAAAPQVHVLVIGETARADRWGLYGYQRDTTPQLSLRQKSGELAVFRDAVSAAAATRESVPLMLTRRPVKAPLEPTLEPSVLTAFSQAGYKTYWLSAQGTAGAHETPVSVLAGEADHQHFINKVDFRGRGALDGELLPLVAQALHDPHPRKFIVLHTLGSHLNYAHRYPAEFERYTPALKPDDNADVWSSTPLQSLNNAYDNSVLYTDHVLDRLIALINAAGGLATVTYAGDHGEVLFDGQCRQGGHGFAANANYRVPMFIWASPAWRSARAPTWARLGARRDAHVTALSMFATLTDLAGFDANFDTGPKGLGEANWSVFPRMVTHYGDYDRNVRRTACDASPEDRQAHIRETAALRAAKAGAPPPTEGGRAGTPGASSGR